MANAKEPSGPAAVNWAAIGRGTLVSIAAALILSFIAGFVFYATSITEAIMPWAAAFILFFSVATGGALAAHAAGGKGLFHGLAVGVGFFLVFLLVAAVAFPGPLAAADIAEKFFLSVSAGAVGGILGVTMLV
ncbi:MAG: TIGR04086 family membrane protein [Bacillota bacterium]